MALVALASRAAASSGGGAVKDISFKNLVAAAGDRVALFYFTSDGLHEPVVAILEQAAAQLRDTYPGLLWNKVDGDASEENAKEFKSVGDGTWEVSPPCGVLRRGWVQPLLRSAHAICHVTS